MFNFLGGPFQGAIDSQFGKESKLGWLKSIVEVLDDLIIPITIVVAIAGAIWVIILGVKLARAETADKAKGLLKEPPLRQKFCPRKQGIKKSVVQALFCFLFFKELFWKRGLVYTDRFCLNKRSFGKNKNNPLLFLAKKQNRAKSVKKRIFI